MTRLTLDFGHTMHNEAAAPVSSDANFVSGKFPDYKIGSNNVVIELEGPRVPSLREIVAKETALLLEQQKRLSVRDLAKRFENGLSAAIKISDEGKCKEVASLDRHVLLKKLRDVLESLKGRVAGRNKDDMAEAISMVEALAVQFTHQEGELLHEKSEVKKLATFLQQATEEARNAAEEEMAFARAEVENARAVIERVERAVQEHEKMSMDTQKQDVEELMKEVQEARRIKMLHQPSKVMDMEHELQALRMQLADKSLYTIQLRKELAMVKKLEENKSLYDLDGFERLGSCLRIVSHSPAAPDISSFSVQWFRVPADDGKKELIYGATKPAYAPDPCDVGRFLQAEVVVEDQKFTLRTTGPVEPAPGLGSYVEALVKKNDTEFHVVVLQTNGGDNPSSSVHVFHVGKMRIKLRKGRSSIAKEPYSAAMQLCGVRGGGNAAARSLFWQARKGPSFTLAFESERERNAAIMLARRFAFDCNVSLVGPNSGGDQPVAATGR
ncbi:unnamed protein product [Spirodela intermedia]|uniref:Uncharacterized protein n=1 Tax=Spirodela intermedia TaxID=51605 RepID=A0A7I8KMJ4_SPIIN|nr:unnamed protein product [Spirodela intermedia]